MTPINSFQDLPHELRNTVLGFIDGSSLARLACVSRAARSDTQAEHLWEKAARSTTAWRTSLESVTQKMPGASARDIYSVLVTGEQKRPWLVWASETHLGASWYTLQVAPAQRLAVTPLILNSSAGSAASAGLVVGITY